MGDIADMQIDKILLEEAEQENHAIFLMKYYSDNQIIEMCELSENAPNIIKNICMFFHKNRFITKKQKRVLCLFCSEE